MICLKIQRVARLAFPRARLFSSSKREQQVEFYSQVDDWWDTEKGKLKSLHSFNRPRLEFIQHIVKKELGKPNLLGLRMLDIGCGGGILSESLARLGADVTGIDPTPLAIEIASKHAEKDPQIRERITYANNTLQELCNKEAKDSFDVVCLSEVIEHIDEQEAFIQLACSLVKPGGGFFLSTLNKTRISYWLGIVGAEYIAGIVPKGTHDWNLFVAPAVVSNWVEKQGFEVKAIKGVVPSSINWKLELGLKLHQTNTMMNYLHFSTKSTHTPQ